MVATAPILSRLHSAEDFGILAVYSAILAMVVTVRSLRSRRGHPAAGGLGGSRADLAYSLAMSLCYIVLLVIYVMAIDLHGRAA